MQELTGIRRFCQEQEREKGGRLERGPPASDTPPQTAGSISTRRCARVASGDEITYGLITQAPQHRGDRGTRPRSHGRAAKTLLFVCSSALPSLIRRSVAHRPALRLPHFCRDVIFKFLCVLETRCLKSLTQFQKVFNFEKRRGKLQSMMCSDYNTTSAVFLLQSIYNLSYLLLCMQRVLLVYTFPFFTSPIQCSPH